MKNKKIEIIYGDPKKLSSFEKAGKLASIQTNFSAATSLCTKKFIKPKLQPLKFRIKVILYKSAGKCSRGEQSKLKTAKYKFEFQKGYFLIEIFGHKFNMIYSKK